MKDTKEQFEQIKSDPDAKVIDMNGKKKKEQARNEKLKANVSDDPDESLPSETESDKELNQLFQGTQYLVRNGYLMRVIRNGDKKEYKTLANFVPIPIEEMTRDDGLNIEKYFTLYGKTSSGMTLREVTIPAEKFNSMNWLSTSWGFAANCLPGGTIKDYLRHAIVEIGGNHATHREVYCHTGWRKVNDKWVFLFSGGSIGNEKISVELEGNLTKYSLSKDSTDYKTAAKLSYDLLNIAPVETMIPLIALTYLSPLNEFYRQAGIEPAFIVFLLGMTGTMKSTLAALILNHFGEFSNKNLPSSFKDTPNALEKKGFLLKDVLTVIDDYHPTSNRVDSQKMELTAQSITRAYGDRTGRNRMNSDTNLKMSYVPRGNLIITGEDTPNIGHSGIARHLTLEVKKGDLKKESLSFAQDNSKLLSISMRGFIEWLMPQLNELPKQLKEVFTDLRSKAQNNSQHARMPETVAWLQSGFILALRYFRSLEIISNEEVNTWLEVSWNIFLTLADRQNKRLDEDKPTRKFTNALRELLATGICYTITTDKGAYDGTKSSGFLGYEDDNYYYLYPDTLYNEVYGFYSSQGENFPVSKTTLFKHLESEKIIEIESENGRINRTKKKSIGNKKYRLLWVCKNSINF